jgi:hypothetical protein
MRRPNHPILRTFFVFQIACLIFLSNITPVHAAGADDFVITVQTDILSAGSTSDTMFTIPVFSGESYFYSVDCNSNGFNDRTWIYGGYTCMYSTPGTYTIRIKDIMGTGDGFPRIYFYGAADDDKIISIDQWGTSNWTSMEDAFNSCEKLTLTATDVPDLSGVT